MKRGRGDSFWVSYSDLATGLMMVFILVACVLAIRQTQRLRDLDGIKQQVQTLVEDVNELASLRLQLAATLKERVGGMDGVQVDEVTARVTVEHTALGFETEQIDVGTTGHDFLDRFIPEYACALAEFERATCAGAKACMDRLDPRRSKGIRRILVTGHADLQGDYEENYGVYGLQRARNVVGASLGQDRRCAGLSGFDVRAYLESRLQAASGGEIEHCLRITSGDSRQRCSELADEVSAHHRTVTFEVELVGDDISGLALNLVALDAVVSDGATTAQLLETLRPMLLDCARRVERSPDCSAVDPAARVRSLAGPLQDEMERICAATESPGYYCDGPDIE